MAIIKAPILSQFTPLLSLLFPPGAEGSQEDVDVLTPCAIALLVACAQPYVSFQK